MPSAESAVPKTGFNIQRLALSSVPATARDAEYEPVTFNVYEFLRKLHSRNAVSVDDKWKWKHPRLGTVAIFLGQTVEPNVAHDLAIILDRVPKLDGDQHLKKRRLSLKMDKESYLNPYTTIAHYLSDIFISGAIPQPYLRGGYSREYMLKLAKVWMDKLYLQLESLLFTGGINLENKQTTKDLSSLSVRKRVGLMERNALLNRIELVKGLKSSIKLIENTL